MRATLQVIASPSRPRRIELRDGQAARFGRSEWADYGFREDTSLADVHFAVACLPAGCFLRHLALGQTTLVNDEAVVQDVRLRSGDRITAGRTTLTITVEGEAIVAPGSEHPSAAEEKPAGPERKSAADWQALAEYLELDPEAGALIKDPQSLDEWIGALVAEQRFVPAARLRANSLSGRAAVWWGCLCVELDGIGERLPPVQRAARDAARAWVATPSEPLRRQAETAADHARYRGTGGLLAAAAFWSGPSLAPAHLAPIPPDPRLPGQAITGTLVLASLDQSPKLAIRRWPRFLDLGQAVAAGEHPWPEPTTNL